MIDYHIAWFLLLMVLLMGYAILDGFDLGVGILHPFTRTDHERRLALNAIGPLWDGNEVWLVTFGGALFAAFPDVYATVLSGMYLPIMAVLSGLIGRAVSIEFRSKVNSAFWRSYWDWSFFASSVVVVGLFGVALGNVVGGIPVGADREFVGTIADFFSPFALSIGVLAVMGAAMHGAIYLHLKTEGELHERTRGWMWKSFFGFALAYAVATVLALDSVPHVTHNFDRWPWAWGVVVLNVLAVANIPRAIHHGRPGWAFASSCCTIAALTFMVGMALFPNLVVSSIDPKYSLDIMSAASSDGTLRRMSVIALIGMPLVATYTTVVYWIFRGKVRLGENSY